MCCVKEKREPEQYPLQRRHFNPDGYDLGHVQTFYPPNRTVFDQTPVSAVARATVTHAWYTSPPPVAIEIPREDVTHAWPPDEIPPPMPIEIPVTIDIPCEDVTHAWYPPPDEIPPPMVIEIPVTCEENDPMFITKKDIVSFMNTYDVTE
jgi:hypothetical protein